jgi:superfamily I DNA/RNA helicase
MSRRTVVHAAAGCGKTTDLARRYLSFLREGIPARKVIAITFTRKAAAELDERVSLALRAGLGGAAGDRARERLGAAYPLYAADAPQEPALAREALASLPEAPIGTTDSFVQTLLTEFALDAALPISGGRRIPLDLPITPSIGVNRALERAARRVLDPPDGSVDPDVALLVRYMPLGDLLTQLARRTELDHLPVATSSEVLTAAARWMAEVLVRHDLVDAYDVKEPRDRAAWVAALEKATNVGGKWAVEPVAEWLSGSGDPALAPLSLCGWLRGLNVQSRKRKALRTALGAELRSFGPATLSLWQVVEALRYPYDDPHQVELADRLRAARWRLRQRVLDEGLEQAALAGELGYEELIEAAIDLCRQPSPRLLQRFGALLVDEVQDADPRQLRLYEALAAMPGMQSYFVGDARQSIYMFRGAEPNGLASLQERADRQLMLATNRRSAPRLVDAHLALFAALEPEMRKHQWEPLESLRELESDPGNARLALTAAEGIPADPVWVVVPQGGPSPKDDDLDDRALTAFLRRLDHARSEPGHELDTAAVLAPNWAVARRACERIREWTGRVDAAFVEHNPGRSDSRVGGDLRLWLRAALDRGDDVAWIGVWKHPAVGLSDAALARLAHGVGTLGETRGWHRRPGFFLEVDALGAPHAPADIEAFARARPVIRGWLAAIGSTSTAAALERVVTALDWRTLLRAGPGGVEDLAELEVMLDWIRGQDANGQPADVILARLELDHDRPHVHLRRPPGFIACTTVFQCKGLAWDHVCVLRPGRHSRKDPARAQEDGWLDLGGRRVRLEGLEFDPSGGLLEFRDPLGRLAARIHAARYCEESARLVYVAITRARRSVTMAPIPRKTFAKKDEERTLSDVINEVWRLPLPNVALVEEPDPTRSRAVEYGFAAVTGEPWLPAPSPSVSAGPWEERAPSSLGARLDPDVRARHASSVLNRIRLNNGLHLGGPPLAPPGTDPLTGQGLAGHPLGHLAPYDWGNIVHGWFASWRFRGTPDPVAVRAYLASEWGGAPDAVVEWLVAIGQQLAEVKGPVWSWVTAPENKLHFEHPLLALAAGRDQGSAPAAPDLLLSGRIDLWIEHPRNRVSIVDFKAGGLVPTGWDDLVVRGSLKTYSFQLHGYADALRRIGREVDQVALWFVRTGTSVRWRP